MKEQLDQFIALVHTGKLSLDGKTPDRVEVNDPTNLYQCMDEAYAWCDFIKIPRDTIRHLYAFEVYTKPFDITLQYFEVIPNTPAGIPKAGDLVVFSKDIGSTAGHISIATGEGDTNTFKTYDQNFGADKNCRFVTHTYSAVLGWLRPRVEEMNDDIKRALNILEQVKVTGGYGNIEATVRALVGKADDLVKVQNDLKEYKDGENLRIETAVNTALSKNNADWQTKLDTANKTIGELNGRIEVLTLNQVDNMSWRDLMSIAWKKFWIFKKGGEK